MQHVVGAVEKRIGPSGGQRQVQMFVVSSASHGFSEQFLCGSEYCSVSGKAADSPTVTIFRWMFGLEVL